MTPLKDTPEEVTIGQLLRRAEALKHPDKLVWPKKKLKANCKVVGRASHRIKRIAVVVDQLERQLKKLDKRIDAMPDCAFRDDLQEKFDILDRQCYLLKERMRLEIRSEFWEELGEKRYVGVASGGWVFYLNIPGVESAISSIDKMVDDIIGDEF